MKITECDIITGDGSRQFNMVSDKNGVVQFATLEDEMCAHTWQCPTEGRAFLNALEQHAKNIKKELTIPTVINPKLVKILLDNNYYPKNENVYFGECMEVCETWRKRK
jgi:hypothetical protein